MGSEEVNAFLTHLAVKLNVSAATQNQALSALLLLYRELLERDLDLQRVVRAHQRRRLPVVLTAEEGGKDRRTLLPARLVKPLCAHLEKVKPRRPAVTKARCGCADTGSV